jgi:ABC-type polysaccharide/polyol phosphate export permease
MTVTGWGQQLLARRDVLYSIVQREIKIKYKQSIMGFAWAIFMPLLIVSAGILVKVAFASLSGTKVSMHDVASVSVKAIPWAFFVSAIRFASLSLVSNSNLVTKIYLPREIFPFAAVVSQLLDLAVAGLGLVIILPILGLPVRVEQLWVIPLILLLVVFTTGLGLFLSAASLFFRDVKYLVEVFVTFAIFFTPVFYDVEMFGPYANLLLLNPVAPILEGIRAAVIGDSFPALGWMAYSIAFALLGFVAALVMFKRVEPYFAESV